jgi:sodium-dependent dicarboxylate transporter 2/3/5
MSYEERAISAVMLGTLAAWIVLGEEYGLANIAIMAVIVLFAMNLASWHSVEQYVNWGVILMYGGAIALGTAVSRTGAATWLSQQTISVWADSPATAVAIISATSLVLTEAVSNSAVVALLMPVTLGVAADFEMPPRIMALVTAVPAGLAFAFPIGTPANAIAFSSGYLRMRDIVLPGVVLAVSAWCVFNLVANFYWPLIGIPMRIP